MKTVYDSHLKQYKTLYHNLANSRETVVAPRKRKMAASVKGLRPIISPSILSADFANLAQEVAAVYRAGSEWIHVDVFDGNFVPNLTIGPPVVKSLRKHTDAFLDCHLCVLNPQNYLDGMIKIIFVICRTYGNYSILLIPCRYAQGRCKPIYIPFRGARSGL